MFCVGLFVLSALLQAIDAMQVSNTAADDIQVGGAQARLSGSD